MLMAQTPEGHVQSVSREETTPTGNPDARIKAETVAPSHVRMEQLRAQKLEIDDARQQLVREYRNIEEEIKRRGDGGRARTLARDVHRRILTDDGTLPHFARASQNIAAATALLHGLPEAATSEIAEPAEKFARCLSVWRRSRRKARCLGDASSTPASARPRCA